MKKFILTFLAALTLSSGPALAEHGSTLADNAVEVEVNGLVCDFCARALEKVFGKQEEVSDITVDLDTKHITITFLEGQSLDNEAIASLIADSGYDVRKIHRAE